ncbi:putative polyamine transporter 4 [Massariosphaeria phaeospora]|uniref:Putative polyamine transporter 4 n=1 Tax=Massariosphaeria phaeospora TaxID=100035 RepID=A0A7C8IFC1_9PLEO|nr:putative polyamine transporter 4 [Massariosphaeria phaeospora]
MDARERGSEASILPQATYVRAWDDPTNAENPQNWPVWKKVMHSAIPALYGFALTIGTSTYVAGLPHVMRQFDVGRTVALLPIVVYTLGFTLGPLIAAPISELYGRLIIYRTNLPMLVVFNAIAAASNNLPVLIIFRFLAGFGGSGVLAVGAGTIADLWAPHQVGLVGLTYILAPFLGPTLGPLVGAYIVDQYENDWKYSIWVILFIAAPVGVAILFMQETSKSRIQYLKAKKRGDHLSADKERVSVANKIKSAMLRPLHMCFLEPLAFFISLYTGFNFAMIFSFFGSYSYVYLTVYHFNQKETGLAYIGLVVGFFLALATFGYFDKTKYQTELVRTNGKVAPEHRLYAAMFGSFLLPIGLFWFAWAPRPSVHWIVPVLAGVPFGWGTLAVFLASLTYLVDTYQVANGASAVAANGLLRFTLGAIFPLFTVQMYEKLGIQWAGSIFAFISVAMIPVPWIFFWKGKQLRQKSAYNTCDY